MGTDAPLVQPAAPVMSGEPSRRAPVRVWLAPVVVLLAGLLLTGIAVLAARANVRQVRGLEVDALAQDARTAIERRIAANAEVLYGLRSLYGAKRPLGRGDFKLYMSLSGVFARYPGVGAVSFNRRVSPAGARGFEAGVRRDTSLNGVGYPNFRIHPETAVGDRIVVDYLEPLEGNEAAFGFDVYSDPIRRAAIDETRDTGDVVATAPIRLVQETGGQRGFLLFLAVYDTPAVPVTAPARRRRFEGVMTVVYGVDDLLAGVLSDRRVRVERIYDVGPTVASESGPLSSGGLLAINTGRGSARDLDPIGARFRLLDLNVGSRRWRMLVAASAGAATGAERLLPWIVGLTGSISSLLLAGLVLSIAGSRTRALALAATMTADLREHERELERANARLDAGNRAMRDFLAIASHDMRSPLAAVIGFSRWLLDAGERMSDEERRRSLEVIARRADQLSRLVNDLLVTSEIEAGALRPHDEPVDVGAAITQSLEDFRERSEALRSDCPPGLRTRADPSHLSRIIINLVDNALRYGAPPVRVEALGGDGRVEIRVRDSGSGVPQEFVPRLFEKFARAEMETGEAAEGTGLGLSIVRGLARANGGDAWYEPSSDGGACFVVSLPSA